MTNKHVMQFDQLNESNFKPINEMYHSGDPDLYTMFQLVNSGFLEDIEKTWLGNSVYAIRFELNMGLEYLKKFDYKNAALCFEEVASQANNLKDAVDWAQVIKDDFESKGEEGDSLDQSAST